MVGCVSPTITRPSGDDTGTETPDAADNETPIVTPARDAGAPTDAGSDAPALRATGLQVFVTSTTTTGNIGGLATADLLCQSRGFALGVRWAAWLSVEDGPHARDRITSAGPWSLPTGEVVAADKAALLSGQLAHAIDRDEAGNLVSGENVWTGSGTDGKYGGRDCDRWTTGTNGHVGNTSAVNGAWTKETDQRCTNARRLYCFEL